MEVPVAHDTAETLGDGPWRHFVAVAVGAHEVPAVRLELRLVTELMRRRRDRSAPLLAFLAARGCDRTLVARGLANARIATRTRTAVLAGLARRG